MPRAGQSKGSPNSAARYPSIIADMGLNSSTQRHLGGTADEGRITDETNSHSWMMNGSAKRTSRYFTFNADIQVPTPRPNSAVSKTNTGRNTTWAVTGTR